MNKKQLQYRFGRLFNNNDIIFSCNSGLLGCTLIRHILNYQNMENPMPFIITEGILLTFCGFMSIRMGLRTRFLSLIENYEIKTNKSKYPLEHSKKVIIDDSNGLEMLLDKTARKEDLEWGTMLNAYDDKGRAVIYKISDPELLKNFKIPGKKLVKKDFFWEQKMTLSRKKIVKSGYNGFHHYHPFNEYGNFTINVLDRFSPHNWINLLTFNLPEGPEIIGYNNRFVYIPKDKTKKELLLASPKKIMEYLS